MESIFTNFHSQAVNGVRYDVSSFLKKHMLRWLEAQVILQCAIIQFKQLGKF